MKKFFSLLLSLCLIISLAACSVPSGATSEPSPKTSTTVPEQTDAPHKETTAGPSTAPTSFDEKLGDFDKSATIAETVMVDESGVKITATGLNYTDHSVDLELVIENNSDKDLSFVSGSLGYSCNSINGYMVTDGYLNCDVAGGKKAIDSISFSYDSLLLYGIDRISDVEIGFDISDDDYNHIYSGPRQVKTSVFESHDYSIDYYGDAITSEAAMNTYSYEISYFSQDSSYDEGGIKLMSSGIMKNRSGDMILLLELLNTTDNMVYVATSDISINRLAVYSSTWSSDAVAPGKRVIVDINLSSVLDSEYWDIYGIKEVGAISLSLSQKNEEYDTIVEPSVIEIVLPNAASSFDSTGTEVYNSSGLRIVAKVILEDPSEYSSDLYVLLLAENNSGTTLTIDDVYDSLSVNGFMTDYSFYGMEVQNDTSTVLQIKLLESALEGNQISSVSDVKEVEIGFEITEGRTTIDKPTITIMFD